MFSLIFKDREITIIRIALEFNNQDKTIIAILNKEHLLASTKTINNKTKVVIITKIEITINNIPNRTLKFPITNKVIT